MQRHNEGTLEALASPSFKVEHTDFSAEIEIDPISTYVWIFGTGVVEIMMAGEDEYFRFAPDNAGSGNIFKDAIKIRKIGTNTTVPKIITFN